MPHIGSSNFILLIRSVSLGLIVLALSMCVNRDGGKELQSGNKTIELADSLIDNEQFPLSKELLGYFTVVLSTSNKQNPSTELSYARAVMFYHHMATLELVKADSIRSLLQKQTLQHFNENQRAKLYNDMGICMARQEKYDSALIYLKTSIPLLEKLHDSASLAKALNGVGNIHLILNNQQEGLKYYTKALEINKLRKNNSGIALNLLNISSVVEDLGDGDSALLLLQQALPMATNANSKNLVCRISNNIGRLHIDRYRYDSAFRYYTLSYNQHQQHDLIADLYLRHNIAICNFRTGNHQQGLDSLHVIIREAKKHNLGNLLAMATQTVSAFHEIRNNLREALKYGRISGAIKDSLALLVNATKADASLAQVDATQEEFDRQLKESLEVQKIRQSRNVMISLIVISVIFSLFTFLAYRRQRATTISLSETSQQLQEANENLRKISETGQSIITLPDLTGIVGHLHQLLQDFLPTDVLAIGLVDASKTVLEFSGAIEKDNTCGLITYNLDESGNLATLCYNRQQAIIINNQQELPMWFAPDTVTEQKFGKSSQSAVFIPLTVNENRLGVFTIQTDGQHAYSTHHVSALRSIGVYLAIALQNTINYESVKTQRDQLDHALQQLKIREEELRGTNAAKDKFFSIIAHDLKNPFSSILGFSDILSREWDDFDEKTKQTFIRSISLASQSTYRLLENLLMWSRTQTGGIQFLPEPIDLSNVALEAIKVTAGQADAKKIKVISQIPFDSEVVADENMLQTIFRNLLTNAIKFSHPGGMVTMSVSTDEDSSQIEISDEGIGISPEDQARLFKIDQNVKRAGTDNETGSGLGLLLCHELISKHGGRIWVESELGKGSRFIFVLPAPQNHQHPSS